MEEDRVVRLTEFRPLSPEQPEEKSSVVTNLFNKLFRRKEQSEDDLQSQKSVVSDTVNSTEKLENFHQDLPDSPIVNESKPAMPKRKASRSLANVTQRINSILNVNHLDSEGHLVDYNQSHLRQYWMPDARGKECYQCQEKFTTFRRRHHCRICGQIFCSRCCNQEIPGKLLGYMGDLRLCHYCCKEVIRFLDSTDGRRLLLKKTGSDDIATLKETLLRSLAESQVSWRSESCVSEPSSPVTVGEGAMTFGNSSAFGYKERPTKKTSSASQSFLRPLAEEPERAELKSRLEDPLRRSTPVCQPEGQRKPTGDSLFSCSPISGETGQSSRDVVEPTTPFDLLPKIVTVGTDSTPRNNADSSSLTCGQDVSAVCDQDDTSDVEDEWEPDWVKSIGNPTGPITKVEVTGGNKPPISRLFTDVQSQMPSRRGRTLSLQEPMNNVNCLSASPTTLPSFVEDKKLHIKIPKETTVSLSSSLNFPILSRLPSSGNPSPLSNVIRSATDVPDGAKRPSDSEFLPLWFESQGKDLLRYLLFREGLGQSWFDVIWPLAHKISHTVQPSQQRSNEKKGWNISDFVHIKTVSSTDVPQANVTFGTVCSKAVADCRMTNRFHNPSIMLIGSPIEYERIAGKFCSIDPVIMQESEYLKNVVSKIASHKPHIVVVQQSVARLAQEYLRLANITLVYHLKPTVVDRIARVTGANMVTSIDGQLMKPKLGTCGCFRTETVKLLNGQQKTLMYFEDCEPNRSCSIVLSGPTNEELTVAKRILRFTIKSLYSSKLELAMLKSRHVDASHLCPKSAVVRTSIEGASKEESDTTPFGGCEVCFHIYQSSAAVNSGQNRSSAGMDPLQMSLAEALTLVPLTGSPIIQYSLPFLEYNKTEHSKRKLSANSILFPFDPSGIPSDLSACLASTNRRKSSKLVHSSATEMPLTSDCVSEDHPFLRMKMTRRASDPSLRRILAQYRAEGAELMRRQLEMKRGTSAGGPRKTSRKNESLGNRSLDVLDPLRHSHIDVLFCSFSNEATNFCLSPKYYGIVYYDGVHDRSLEDFLNDFCFTNAICRSKPAVCTAPFVNHIRRFVHGFACVEISMETIEVAVDGSLEASMGIDEILTWDWCYGCKTASTPTSMGSDFRNLSIGRYVEYLCSATYLQAPKSNSECRHCLFHNHWQYFALGNFVACFKVFPVNPQEIILPPTVCEMGQNLVSVTSLIDQAKVLLEISGRMFTVMLEQLCALNSIPDLSPWLGTRFSDVVDDLKVIAEEQQSHFRAVIGLLQETLTQFEPSVFLGEFSPEYLHCQDLIVRCRFILHTACSQWNDCRTDFISFAKKQKPLAPPVEDKPREKTKEKIKTSQEDLISSEMESSSDPTATPPHTGYIVDMTESANENLNESPIVHQAGSISQSTTGVSKKPTVNDISASRTFTSISEKFGIANLSATIETISPPFESFEHFGLPVSKTVPVGVSEAEISSVVAYSLSSSDYIAKLRDLRNLLVDQGVGISLRHPSFSPPQSYSKLAAAEGARHESPQKASNNVNEVPSTVEATSHSCHHIELQFSDSTTDFYCKIYFAEYFRIMRKLIFPQGETTFINSLAHCGSWRPTGGKSGLNFFKTADDRFVLKQLSRYEVQSFMKFAAKYFDYLATAVTDNRLTSLAKIVGVYRIGYRNNQTGAAMKIDVIVMENLFYKRNISQVFDLKGSMRNRLVHDRPSQTSEDLVLLDENLLKKMCRDPLYVHAHSKAALVAATTSDSNFLAKNLIMDYSLLVGIDEEHKELVVGIIDYIRTYTWDKRLETFVKSVSVSGPPPTIVSPELYCSRFREAMGQYFLVVPEKWHKFIPKQPVDTKSDSDPV